MFDYTSIVLICIASTTLGYFLAKFRDGRRYNLTQNSFGDSDRSNGLLYENRIKEAVEKYKTSDEYNAIITLNFEQGKTEGAEIALRHFKASDEFETRLNLEHTKGKTAGEESERNKFEITYTTVIIDHESWISHKVDVGYDMQIRYAGFPIGEPTRRITNHQEKSKDENINKLVEMVTNSLELIAVAASKQKIPVVVSKKPSRLKVAD